MYQSVCRLFTQSRVMLLWDATYDYIHIEIRTPPFPPRANPQPAQSLLATAPRSMPVLTFLSRDLLGTPLTSGM